MAAAELYVCPLCSASFPTLKLYVSHLRVLHSKDPAFHILCDVGGCREVFRAFSAFSSHVYRHHRSDMGIVESKAPSLPQSLTSDRTEQTDVDPTETMECDSRQENVFLLAPSSHTQGDDSQMPGTSASEANDVVMAAKMLLQLREGHQVSQVAISEVVAGCRLLCSQALDNFKRDITIASQANDGEGEDLSIILNRDYDPFRNIDTNYRFEKFCIDHLGCLVNLNVHAWLFMQLNNV